MLKINTEKQPRSQYTSKNTKSELIKSNQNASRIMPQNNNALKYKD